MNSFDKNKAVENIFLAIDATNINMSALDFACYLGRLTQSKVTGIFLERGDTDERAVSKEMQGRRYFNRVGDEYATQVAEKINSSEANIAIFRETCERKRVQYAIHRDRGVPAAEMIAESRYADIIVTDAATSFRKVSEGPPTNFVRDLLTNAECPVIIAPESFEGVDRIIFAYDGSASSVFAMKQFTYLFPRFEDRNVTVFHVNENRELVEDEKRKVAEWLENHYAAVCFETVAGSACNELFSYLLLKKNVFIVMGAYGRSSFSQFCKNSHADILMKTITQPIFIAHH